MTRTNAQGKPYNEDQERLATLAESLGWVVDDSDITQLGLRFSHGEGEGEFCVWASIYIKPHWRKCEYIGGYASNHKSFATCEDALRSGYEPDTTLGLGQHGIAIGARIKWRTDIVDNPNPNGQGDRWVEVYTEGTAMFAFGEAGRYIHVRHDDGREENINSSELRN